MFRGLFAALLALLFTACTALPQPPIVAPTVGPQPTHPSGTSSPKPGRPTPTAPPSSPQPFWDLLFPGAEVRKTDDGLALLRHGAGLARYNIRIVRDPDETRSVSSRLQDDSKALAAVNCGFYWEKEGEFLHMGLLEVHEKRLANVRAKWGAALVIRNNRALVVRKPKKRIPPMELGVQGWPLLLWNGKRVKELDEENLARRTAVGVDAAGRVVWVVDGQGSTLKAFAQRLRQKDIGLLYAVNLDGGASTGLRWRTSPEESQQGIDSFPIPCVITFTPR